ncbi:hypothetical protein GALMADRAFT_142823 [Galerina marginata CBS 339.88]|uniref:AMP-dependent synthetase/ligase domain-containing protein n=1 Tax=Galerina marginata (strain CBS 339.88) TaxID=685588 RepID=A0A067SNP2_GALM3|nr:hypothetical protein GALMADRAFT_142823 [Galerina marginata CBS 339.88]
MIASTRAEGSFIPPPFDLPLEFAFDFHFKENQNQPALIYPTDDGRCFRSYNYKEIVPAVHRTGQWISSAINFQGWAGSSPPVVVIFLKTDTMTYLTAIAGLMRAGVTAFPISPRFSSTVNANLFKESQPAAVIINSATETLAKQALEEYAKGCEEPPLLCEFPSFSSLYPGHDMYDPLPRHVRKMEDISIITHSSSSSSLFPKVIFWSSRAILHHGEIKGILVLQYLDQTGLNTIPDFPVHQFAGQVLGSFGLELFHSLGMCIFFTMVRRGLVLGVMDPAEQTSILPADMNDIFRCFKLSQPDFLLTNPRAIELWAEDPKKMAVLRDSSANIVYGGRFLSKSVGDRLVRSGVKICTTYGSTESGPITLLPHFQGEDWEYWTVYPRPDISFIPREDGLFELVVAPTDELNYLAISNTTWKGKPAYNPGDLFVSHPIKKYTYKIFGRSSDQIMLATGETINPIEIESELSNHPLVSSVIMFGHSRFTIGIVIEQVSNLQNGQENNPSEKIFLDKIWPAIVEINSKSPSYSNISRQMIIVAHSKKPISISPKGLPRRPIVWLQYQDEMDALYAMELKGPK